MRAAIVEFPRRNYYIFDIFCQKIKFMWSVDGEMFHSDSSDGTVTSLGK